MTKLVNDAELAAELSSRRPAEAAEALIKTVLSRGAPDNISIIITKLT